MSTISKINLKRFGVEASAVIELAEAHNKLVDHVDFLTNRVDRLSEQWDKFMDRVSRMCTNLPPVDKPCQCPKDSDMLPEERQVNGGGAIIVNARDEE